MQASRRDDPTVRKEATTPAVPDPTGRRQRRGGSADRLRLGQLHDDDDQDDDHQDTDDGSNETPVHDPSFLSADEW
jgi:hypothetical protein